LPQTPLAELSALLRPLAGFEGHLVVGTGEGNGIEEEWSGGE